MSRHLTAWAIGPGSPADRKYARVDGVTEQRWQRAHRIGFGALFGVCVSLAVCFVAVRLLDVTVTALAAVLLGLCAGVGCTLLVRRLIRQ